MRELRDMTEPELRGYFGSLAELIEDVLPPGPSAKGRCLFAIIVADSTAPGIGQYVSNMERAGTIKLLRETADRLEAREDIPR
jgi:hypothetical protein